MAEDKEITAQREAKAKATFWSTLIIAVVTALPTCSVAGYSVYNANAGVKAESDAKTPIINGLVKDIVTLTIQIKVLESIVYREVLHASQPLAASSSNPAIPKSLAALRALTAKVSALERTIDKAEEQIGPVPYSLRGAPMLGLGGLGSVPDMPDHETIQKTYR